MYSSLKNVQYLVAMLKARGIKRCVISPGNSHNAIVRSIENDGFFITYNIVDERSAAFFAIGMIQELNEPVAICCTAGTAASNYLTGVTEASRRNLPLVIITGDKNPYYLAQNEDQMIDQLSIFREVTKCSRSLPMIKDKKDEWYCNRILNEAFLEMDHHGIGPIHINVPIEEGMLAIGESFSALELPNINVIKRFDINTPQIEWENVFNSLNGKKVLFLCGQDYNINKKEIMYIENVFTKYNCAFSIDKLSNLRCNGTVETSSLVLFKLPSKLVPDVVITFGGNSISNIKGHLKKYSDSFEHWIISEEGSVADPLRNLSKIFECTTLQFLEKMSQYGGENDRNSYYNLLNEEKKQFRIPEFDFSNLYTVQKLMCSIPANSILNLANSTTIRISQFFDLDESVQVYCNRGVNGIDGCLSTFIGQSCVTNKLSFIIIGDLTFFYDMNALWNRYVGKNVRIMLNNNEGAALFHFNQGLNQYPTLNQNVAAEHFTTAEGWVVSQGFKYLSARSKEEFDEGLEEFLSTDVDKPIIFEVFTKKENDAKLQHEFYELNKSKEITFKSGIKKAMVSVLGEETVKKLKGTKF